mmetsp:Transcript_10665/g.21269  ORF Transcript_10665/g.21269 Transcript_10665/m.21269 type:complete len:220 (+) Transcript_10665:99-758(+)
MVVASNRRAAKPFRLAVFGPPLPHTRLAVTAGLEPAGSETTVAAAPAIVAPGAAAAASPILTTTVEEEEETSVVNQKARLSVGGGGNSVPKAKPTPEEKKAARVEAKRLKEALRKPANWRDLPWQQWGVWDVSVTPQTQTLPSSPLSTNAKSKASGSMNKPGFDDDDDEGARDAPPPPPPPWAAFLPQRSTTATGLSKQQQQQQQQRGTVSPRRTSPPF